MEIKNKNILITGASRGIGCYIANAIAKHGGNIALLALPSDLALLQNQEEKLMRFNVTAKYFTADLSDSQQISDVIKRISEEFGEIDIFISNAAIESIGIFEEQTEQVLEKTIAVNLLAPMLITKKLLPQMQLKKSGHIVAISSFAGKIGSPYQSVYSATKAGLNKWILGMKREYKSSGVSFSAISPNYVSNTGMYADVLKKADENLRTPKIAGEVTPQKVASVVVSSILKDKTDKIVGSPLLRAVSALNELAPNFVSNLLELFKIPQYNKKLASVHHAKGDIIINHLQIL